MHAWKAVRLERPTLQRAEEFLAAVHCSRPLHQRWATPPSTPDAYRQFIEADDDKRRVSFFVIDDITGDVSGVVNMDEIVRGVFQSAYLGFYALLPFAGKGYMQAGLVQVINYAFRKLKLHRLEANIQPGNHASIALVERLGFQLEGVSPKYLKIAGRWRDHERWAVRTEEWRQ